MPFDATGLRQPTVTVLPPTPPERGGGPQRIIRIEIEFVERRATPAEHSTRVSYRFGTFTLWLLALLLLAALAHAQDIDLVCNPFEGDEDSIKRNNLHIHIHLGDKPQMTFWDGTQPDFVSPSASEIYFRWDAKRADGQHHDGNINRVTGKTAVWAYDHFEIAECLPVKRLF